MAWTNEVPTFVAGEPGFAAKLNQLSEALRETRAALDEATAPLDEEAPADEADADVEAVEDEPAKPARSRKTAAK